MSTPEALERQLFERWEREEITLPAFVDALVGNYGWTREEVYDWLCDAKKGRRPLTSKMKALPLPRSVLQSSNWRVRR